MKKFGHENVLVKIYLLSRYVIKNSKKFSKKALLRAVLTHILNEKPRTVRELSTLYSTNHSFMSATVSMMEKEGLVKKKRHKDQRFRVVHLTPKGRKLVGHVKEAGCECCEGFFSKLTDKEVEQLGDLISNLDYVYRPKHFK